MSEYFIKVSICTLKAIVWPTHEHLFQTNCAVLTLHKCLKWTMSGEARAKAHSPSLAKVSAIIITVCAQSGCVLSYSLSQSSEETREFGTDSARGQDNLNIQHLHVWYPLVIFSLEGQDEMQAQKQKTDLLIVVLITLRSSLLIKVKGDRVWEGKWLSHQQAKSISFHSSFHFTFGCLMG